MCLFSYPLFFTVMAIIMSYNRYLLMELQDLKCKNSSGEKNASRARMSVDMLSPGLDFSSSFASPLTVPGKILLMMQSFMQYNAFARTLTTCFSISRCFCLRTNSQENDKKTGSL